MKKILCALLAVLLLASLGITAFADGERQDFKEVGLTLTFPDEFKEENMKGSFTPYPSGRLDDGLYYISFIYNALPKEELAILSEKSMDELTEADLALVRSKQTLLAALYVIDFSLLSDRNLAILEDELANNTMAEFTKNGDVTTYLCNLDEATAEFLAKNAPAYQEEFLALQASLLDVLKNAELYKPVVPGESVVGKEIRFEGTDLDGKPVKIEDVFKEHEITMVNLWATWCHNCVDEMTGLGDMARSLADKNVAVVGICMDADDQFDACRAILQEHNVDYLNLMPVEGMEELLDWDGALPTSYFFDSNGKLLCIPFRGAPRTMDDYLEVIDGLLAGNEVNVEKPDAPHTAPNGENVYRVIVSDTDGNLVKGVTIQFCSDTSCTMGKTDENGAAVFPMEEGMVYTVHVLKVPEGYEKHTGDYTTDETYCDVYISLTKAK